VLRFKPERSSLGVKLRRALPGLGRGPTAARGRKHENCTALVPIDGIRNTGTGIRAQDTHCIISGATDGLGAMIFDIVYPLAAPRPSGERARIWRLTP
jgi:hypothetical protein